MFLDTTGSLNDRKARHQTTNSPATVSLFIENVVGERETVGLLAEGPCEKGASVNPASNADLKMVVETG